MSNFDNALFNPVTDKIRQKDTRIKYFKLWDDAALFHQKACFVTLTLDPKNFDNLWDANKDVMNAFHDLIDFIRKRIKEEIKRYPEFKLMFEAIKRGHTVDQEFLSGRRNILYRLLFEQYRRYKTRMSRIKTLKKA